MSRRADRLRSSCLSAGRDFALLFFVVLVPVLLVVNPIPESGFFGHLVGTSLTTALSAAGIGAVVAFAGWNMTRVLASSWSGLEHRGTLLRARRAGRSAAVGGQFMTYTVGGALGVLWEPLAPLLGRRFPLFAVSYAYDLDGKEHRAVEYLYGDEEVIEDGEGQAYVLVDRSRPDRRRFLLRRRGGLRGVPFAAPSNDARRAA